MVGLVPLLACLVLDEKRLKRFPAFEKRTRWFLLNRKYLDEQVRLVQYLMLLSNEVCIDPFPPGNFYGKRFN